MPYFGDISQTKYHQCIHLNHRNSERKVRKANASTQLDLLDWKVAEDQDMPLDINFCVTTIGQQILLEHFPLPVCISSNGTVEIF